MSISRKYRALLAVGGVPRRSKIGWHCAGDAFLHQLSQKLGEEEYFTALDELVEDELIEMDFDVGASEVELVQVRLTEKGWSRYIGVWNCIERGNKHGADVPMVPFPKEIP